MSNKRSPISRKSTATIAPTKGASMVFWKWKTLEELAAEQGVRPIERLEEVLGRGADLWRDEAEWEAFVSATIYCRHSSIRVADSAVQPI